MSNDLKIAEKVLKKAEIHYVELCKQYSNSEDTTDGALFEILKAMKAYDDAHIEYNIEYSKVINN